MSANYRLKLSKDTIKLKKKGNFTLNKSLDSSEEEVRFNFLLNYYGDSLFTKLSRLHIDKLSEILRIRNLDKLIEASKKKDILKKRPRNKVKLTAKSFQRNFQLNSIYDYERYYFKTSWGEDNDREDRFRGSPAFSVRKKLGLSPKTNLRHGKHVAQMINMHLNYYYTEKFCVQLNEEADEISFVPKDANHQEMKNYSQSLKASDGYLYVNFSKKNLFLTLTDFSGNCIRYLSSGIVGLKRREKQKPHATRLLTDKIAKVARLKNIINLTIIFNPNNRYQRWRIKPIMRTLEMQNILIKRVQRKVVQAHGGCRKKKSRRI
jgi:ribosomal protein S11